MPVREPSGRLSRASMEVVDAMPPGEIKRLRLAAVEGMRAPEWGTELGHLYLRGQITEHEYEAGKRWGRLVVAYHRAIGAKPGYPPAMTFYRSDPAFEPDPESEEGKKRLRYAQDIIDDMREAHAVLIGAGMLAERSVRSVCEADQAPIGIEGLETLKRGLQWVAKHWGLTREAK